MAKKSQTAVNVLTIVAVVGVSFVTMALIVVLSVFNGFEKLTMSLFNSMNPDLEITPARGKTFLPEDLPMEELSQIPGVIHIGQMIEETALIMYRNQQQIVQLRGVDEIFGRITGIDTLIVAGNFSLKEGDNPYLVIGQSLEINLGANINDYLNPLVIYIPKRGRVVGLHPAQAFNASSNYISGVFNVLMEYDAQYAFTHISLMSALLEYDTEITHLLLALDSNSNQRQVQRRVKALLGEDFEVKNKLQQEEFYYKVLQSEKWAIFLILSFILLIAAFNITGSLTMLVLEKQKDINILWSMGASLQTIKKIFLFEGLFIGIGGGIVGLIMGGIVCWIQIQFGVISLQAEGSFILDAYPVHVKLQDFILVFFTVTTIGILASTLPILKIRSLIGG